MHRTLFSRWAMILILGASTQAWTQSKHEIGLLLGGTFTPGRSISSTSTVSPGAPISFDKGLNFTLEYNRRIFHVPFAELQAGIDLAVSPNDVKIGSAPPTTRNEYAYLFLNPELRVKLLPNSLVSPWVSLGGGLANYAEASRLLDGQPVKPLTGSHGAAEFSGGVDFQTPLHFLLPIGFRTEVRDYYAGKPDLNLDTGGGFSNNIVVAGEIVLRF